MVFPTEELIAVFTGWDILGTTDPEHEFATRVLTSLKTKECGSAGTQ
jgi:hypothetical protein